MNIGLLTGRRALLTAFALAGGLAALAVLSGCGSGGDDQAATQEKQGALVPGEVPDTAAPDTGTTVDVDSAYEAGTLQGAGGVSEVSEAAGTSVAPDVKAAAPAPAKSPAAAKPAPAAVAPAGGGYNLQLGSFANLDNARKQAARLTALGYAPVIEKSDLGGKIVHRVMLKGVGDKVTASRLGEHIHSELGIAYLVRRAN